MTKDEALKLALEALHGFIPYLPLNDEVQCGRYDEALTAIKKALAQPDLEDIDINITWNENSMRDFGKDELNFARAILRKAQEK